MEGKRDPYGGHDWHKKQYQEKIKGATAAFWCEAPALYSNPDIAFLYSANTPPAVCGFSGFLPRAQVRM